MTNTVRYYSSDALATTLASALGTTGNPSVVSIAGLPASYPYTMLIDWGSPAQEAISVTSAPTGTGPYTLPCTRGIDGSTGGTGGIAHNAGAVVVHGVTAQDFDGVNKLAAGAGGFPWQFNVTAYGAKGDGQVVNDGVMSSTSSQTTLTCATSAPFKSADVGKAIQVKGALTSATGTTLVGTITGFTSSSVVTVSVACTNSITGAMVLWATDDTSAFQQAVNAACTWAQTQSGYQSGPGYCEVFVPPPAAAFYGIAGALQTGGSTLGNAQITIPVIADGGAFGAGPCGNKVTLVFNGGENGAGVRYWNQQVPQTGVTLVSFGVFASSAAQIASINANGNPAVIGGPTGANGYGNATALFSQMLLTLKGISVVTSHSAQGFTYGAVHAGGIANCNLFDFAWGTAGTFQGNDFNSVSSFGGGSSIGVFLPQNGNNANNACRNLVCSGGYTYGLFATEHTDISACLILYCRNGFCLVGSYSGDGTGSSGNAAVHSVKATKLDIEGCINSLFVVGGGAAGIGPSLNAQLSTEGVLTFSDDGSGTPLSHTFGELRLTGSGGGTPVTPATSLRCINDRIGSGPVTAISLTAGVAAKNTYWRPATVLLQGGSAVTAVKVSALMGSTTAPTMTTVFSQSAGALPMMSVRVGPGGWIEVDGDVPAVNSWILD